MKVGDNELGDRFRNPEPIAVEVGVGKVRHPGDLRVDEAPVQVVLAAVEVLLHRRHSVDDPAGVRHPSEPEGDGRVGCDGGDGAEQLGTPQSAALPGVVEADVHTVPVPVGRLGRQGVESEQRGAYGRQRPAVTDWQFVAGSSSEPGRHGSPGDLLVVGHVRQAAHAAPERAVVACVGVDDLAVQLRGDVVRPEGKDVVAGVEGGGQDRRRFAEHRRVGGHPGYGEGLGVVSGRPRRPEGDLVGLVEAGRVGHLGDQVPVAVETPLEAPFAGHFLLPGDEPLSEAGEVHDQSLAQAPRTFTGFETRAGWPVVGYPRRRPRQPARHPAAPTSGWAPSFQMTSPQASLSPITTLTSAPTGTAS